VSATQSGECSCEHKAEQPKQPTIQPFINWPALASIGQSVEDTNTRGRHRERPHGWPSTLKHTCSASSVTNSGRPKRQHFLNRLASTQQPSSCAAKPTVSDCKTGQPWPLHHSDSLAYVTRGPRAVQRTREHEPSRGLLAGGGRQPASEWWENALSMLLPTSTHRAPHHTPPPSQSAHRWKRVDDPCKRGLFGSLPAFGHGYEAATPLRACWRNKLLEGLDKC
jgi:hypothetical protein